VIDDEINWAQWVDLLRISAESGHGISHCSEVNHSWHTCEVLEDHSCGFEGDLEVLLGAFTPVQDSFNVSL
jgi:hypothetical protein